MRPYAYPKIEIFDDGDFFMSEEKDGQYLGIKKDEHNYKEQAS